MRRRSFFETALGTTSLAAVRRPAGVWSEFGGNCCPQNPCGVLVCATIQNLKRTGTKIFFIALRTRTYDDFRGTRMEGRRRKCEL